MVSACCGKVSLQKASFVTGTVEVILASIFILYNGVLLAVETPLAVQERHKAASVPDPYRFHSMRVILSGLNTLFWIGSLLLGLILIPAAQHKDVRRCRSWYVLTCILTVVFVVDILMEVGSMTAPPLAIMSPVVGTLLQCYMLWIVSDFMEQISFAGRKQIYFTRRMTLIKPD